ncbi:MAG: DUF2164 domain-containing protein [Eubacteriales bacterium]
MKKTQKFNLSKEKRDQMVSSIKRYYENEKEEKISDLAAALLLDFFTNELAVEFYNQGVYDSYLFLNSKAEDLLGIQK